MSQSEFNDFLNSLGLMLEQLATLRRELEL